MFFGMYDCGETKVFFCNSSEDDYQIEVRNGSGKVKIRSVDLKDTYKSLKEIYKWILQNDPEWFKQ